MSIYNHDQLFADGEEAVEVYCLPQRLLDYVSDLARTSRTTYSDVVIDALLHYFSDRVVGDLNRAVAGESTGVPSGDSSGVVERMMFRHDPQTLDALRSDFCDYFSASLMQRAEGLQDNAGTVLEKESQPTVDQKDLEIATLKLLLEKSHKQISQLTLAN